MIMTIGLEKMIVLRQHVYDLLGRVQKVDAVKHFQDEKYSKQIIYSIIPRHERGLPVQDMLRKGLPAKLGKKNLR